MGTSPVPYPEPLGDLPRAPFLDAAKGRSWLRSWLEQGARSQLLVDGIRAVRPQGEEPRAQ